MVNVSGNTADITTNNITPTSARYMRLNVTQGQQSGPTARIYEVQVYAGGTLPTNTPARTNTPPPATFTPTATQSSTIPAWALYTDYAVGNLVTYNGLTYSCLQAHTSLTGWEPPNVPALGGWCSSLSQAISSWSRWRLRGAIDLLICPYPEQKAEIIAEVKQMLLGYLRPILHQKFKSKAK